MEKIVIIQLNYLVKRMKERHVTLEWTPEVLKNLAEEGYDPFFGARPLKRLIQTDIVNLLSKAILEGKIPPTAKSNFTSKTEKSPSKNEIIYINLTKKLLSLYDQTLNKPKGDSTCTE